MPKTPDDLLQHLAELGIAVVTHRHPALFTVADSQALRGEIAGGHTKNLFLKDRKDQFFLLTVEESATVDLKSIHTLIGAAGKVSFGKPEALMELLGVIPGAVTPLGLVNDGEGRVRFFLDEALTREEVINVHPLTNEATCSLAPAELIRFARETGHETTVLNLAC